MPRNRHPHAHRCEPVARAQRPPRAGLRRGTGRGAAAGVSTHSTAGEGAHHVSGAPAHDGDHMTGEVGGQESHDVPLVAGAA